MGCGWVMVVMTGVILPARAHHVCGSWGGGAEETVVEANAFQTVVFKAFTDGHASPWQSLVPMNSYRIQVTAQSFSGSL